MSATTPFWLDEPYEARPPLGGDLEVEACVIGAGVGGLSCARSLAQRGIETVVLERDVVAGGASGRNGGFLLAGMAAFYPDARERYGPERARETYARTLAAQQEIYALAAELGVSDAVRRTGLLRVSASEEEAEHVRRHVEALNADGFPGELVERDDLPLALRAGFHNACLTDHDGALQPARWIRALARAAEQAGARIHEHTEVRGPVSPTEAVTPGGTVRARHLIIAADGALPALLPQPTGVRARRLHMVATEPLAQRLLDCPVYARWGYEYFQQLPDGRLLAGGFSDLDGEGSYTDRDEGSAEVWERIERYLAEDLGVEAPVSHRWVGTVGYSDDGLPVIGEADGLHYAGGYSGHGNVLGYMAGRQLADLVAG
ncbi:MAG: gamma-glutamylputrescine oxidase [Thermoleophilaceae bacterium]|nr:gamma-glutamylputrescine oxidase [Thermoleophilaceae bacterium]